ncbi:MAG: DUF2341 domain-containing protein [Spirochaetota bacterium]
MKHTTKCHRYRRSFLLAALVAFLFAGCSEFGVHDLTRSQARDVDFTVSDVSVVEGDEQISLSWTDPTDSRLEAIQVEYTPGAGVLMLEPGTESAIVTGLSNGTDYRFDIYAITGSDFVGPSVSATGTPSFPVFADDAWESDASNHRRRLVLDNRRYPEAFAGFPLMVRLDSSRIDYREAAADGGDLRFFDAGNATELYYEVESWNAEGESIVWVRVPEIAASSRDSIWMYWGGGATTTYANPAEVWSEYEVVLHLANGVSDSSPNGWHGSITGSPTYEAGAVGAAIRIGYDGTTKSYVDVEGYVNEHHTKTLGAYTVEVWMLGDQAPDSSTINGPLMGQNFFNIGWNHQNSDFLGTYHFKHTVRTWASVPASPLSADTWYYAAAVFDGAAGTATSYRNGAVDNELTGYGGEAGDKASYLRLGSDGSRADVFDGLVDEVRITHRTRSAAWISAQHLSMTDGTITFGEVETR